MPPRKQEKREKPLTEEEIRKRQEVQEIKDLFAKSFVPLRKQCGFSSQEALAGAAGVHKESIGRLERGEGNSRFETLIRASLAMKRSLAEVFDAMGQREGEGRQLTVQERKDAVNGLLLALEAFTGRTTGELTERGIERSISPRRGIDVRYPVPGRTSRSPESVALREAHPSTARSSGAEPRKVAKSGKLARTRKRVKSRKNASPSKTPKSRTSAKARKGGTHGRKH